MTTSVPVQKTKPKKKISVAVHPNQPPKARKPATPHEYSELDDIKALSEPKGKASVGSNDPIKKDGRGRQRNPNTISYDEAREFLKDEMIPSRVKYDEWWNRNKPKTIPRFPYRVYKEWVSWNDFLGTSNTFSKGRPANRWKTFDEAIVIVRALKIETHAEWLEYCKKGMKPEDIPARPDLVYNKWTSWNHFFGHRPAELIEMLKKQKTMSSSVFYIIHERGNPENVFTYGTNSSGLSSVKELWENQKFEIIRLFWEDEAQTETVQKVIEHFSYPYLGMNNIRVTPNVFEITYQLEMMLNMIRSEPKPVDEPDY